MQDISVESAATSRSALSEAIERLEVERRDQQALNLGSRVSPMLIALEAEAFNVRGRDLDEYSLASLIRSLKVITDLPPVLVLQCGQRLVLIDGHHRLAAYTEAGRPDIPIELFGGTPREAVLEAAQRGSAATLQMDSRQRQDCSWRLVNSDYTLTQIVQASGVSRAQVTLQRKVRRALGDDAAVYSEWWRAKRAAEGRVCEPPTDDEVEAMKEAQALVYADRIRKVVGNKLATNPEIGALAISKLIGRKLPDFMLFLKWHLDEAGKAYIEQEESFY